MQSAQVVVLDVGRHHARPSLGPSATHDLYRRIPAARSVVSCTRSVKKTMASCSSGRFLRLERGLGPRLDGDLGFGVLELRLERLLLLVHRLEALPHRFGVRLERRGL